MKDTGKVLVVDLEERDELLCSVGDMPVDAVLIDLEDQQITIRQLMYCQWVCDCTSRPLLVATGAALTEDSLRSLWDAGASGIVIRADSAKELNRKLKDVRELIKPMPATRKKAPESGKPGKAFLPRSGGREGNAGVN